MAIELCHVRGCGTKQMDATYFCPKHTAIWVKSEEREQIDFADNTSYELAVAEFAHRIAEDEGVPLEEEDVGRAELIKRLQERHEDRKRGVVAEELSDEGRRPDQSNG